MTDDMGTQVGNAVGMAVSTGIALNVLDRVNNMGSKQKRRKSKNNMKNHPLLSGRYWKMKEQLAMRNLKMSQGNNKADLVEMAEHEMTCDKRVKKTIEPKY